MDGHEENMINRNSPIMYRTLHSRIYKKGILVNMSESSAFLRLAEEYTVGSGLDVVTVSHEKPEHVYMSVERTEEADSAGYTGYRCKVEMTLSEAA